MEGSEYNYLPSVLHYSTFVALDAKVAISSSLVSAMPLWEFLGVSGRVLVAIVAAVAMLCCSCGVIIVVCLYRRNRAMRQPHLQSHPQMSSESQPFSSRG